MSSATFTCEAVNRSGRWYISTGSKLYYEVCVANHSGRAVECTISLDEPPGGGTVAPQTFALGDGQSRVVTATIFESSTVNDLHAVISVRNGAGIVLARLERTLYPAPEERTAAQAQIDERTIEKAAFAIEPADRSVRWYVTPGTKAAYDVLVRYNGAVPASCVLVLDEPLGGGTFDPPTLTLAARGTAVARLTFSEDARVLSGQRVVVTLRTPGGRPLASLDQELYKVSDTDCNVSIRCEEALVENAELIGLGVVVTVKSLSQAPAAFPLEFTAHPALRWPSVEPLMLEPGQTIELPLKVMLDCSTTDALQARPTLEVRVRVSYGKRGARVLWKEVWRVAAPALGQAGATLPAATVADASASVESVPQAELVEIPSEARAGSDSVGPATRQPLPHGPPEDDLAASVVGPPPSRILTELALSAPSAWRPGSSGLAAGTSAIGDSVASAAAEPSPDARRTTEPASKTMLVPVTAIVFVVVSGLALAGALAILLRPPDSSPASTQVIAASSQPASDFPAAAPAPSHGRAPAAAQRNHASPKPTPGPTTAVAVKPLAPRVETAAPLAATRPPVAPAPTSRSVALKPAPPRRPVPAVDRNAVVALDTVDAYYGPRGRVVRVNWSSSAQKSAVVQLINERGAIVSESTVKGGRQTAVLYLPKGYRGAVLVQLTASGYHGERVSQTATLPPFGG